MRAVAYARVSTEEQALHGVSLAAQRGRIRSYAELYSVEIVQTCVDDGKSGDTMNRAGLRDAFEALEDGQAEAVIVAKLDRLSRNIRDLLGMLNDYFTGDRYALLSVAEQLDPRTPAGRFAITILAACAQLELETIRERTREAMQYKKSKGEYTGGGVPYGWCLCKSSGLLQPDKNEQAVLTLARQLRDNGLPLRRVAAELCQAGYYPRGGLRHWAPQQIKRLLRAS